MLLFSKNWMGSLENQRHLLPGKAAHRQLRAPARQDRVMVPQPKPTPGGLQTSPCHFSPVFYSVCAWLCQLSWAPAPAQRHSINTRFPNPGGEAGEEAVQSPGKHRAAASSIQLLDLIVIINNRGKYGFISSCHTLSTSPYYK